MICAMCDKTLSRRNVSGLCRRHVITLAHLPDVRASTNAGVSAYLRANPDIAFARAIRASRARMAWCPLEYQNEYRRLTRSTGLRAAAARRVILDLVAVHAARYRRTGELQQSA